MKNKIVFNFWKRYPKRKPKDEGWYLCTMQNGRVMDLYYDWLLDNWIDKRRMSVFNGYKVYKSGREPFEYNRVFGDFGCIRDDVVAWKKLPKAYSRK